MVTTSLKLPQMGKLPSLWNLLLLWSVSGIEANSVNTWLARGIPQECRIASFQKFSLPFPSALKCAIHMRYNGTTAFDYNGQTCDIYENHSKSWITNIDYVMAMSLDLLEEIALSMRTYSSGPINSGSLSEFANDGDVSTLFDSEGIKSPYWMVDLGEVRIVHLVRILPRSNGCNFIKIWLGMDLVTSGDFSSYTLFAHYGQYDYDPGYLTCYSSGVPGRYLSIQKTKPDLSDVWLTVKEVKVYASPKP